MSKYLFVLLLLYTSMFADIGTPLGTPFDTFDAANKHKPPVPEPSTYGLIFVGLAVAFVLWNKRARK